MSIMDRQWFRDADDAEKIDALTDEVRDLERQVDDLEWEVQRREGLIGQARGIAETFAPVLQGLLTGTDLPGDVVTLRARYGEAVRRLVEAKRPNGKQLLSKAAKQAFEQSVDLLDDVIAGRAGA